MDYYDLDSILCGVDRMTVQFKHDVLHMGHLNPGCDDPSIDMKGGTKLDVPLWLAQTLHDEGAVKLFPPRCFSPKFRDNMEANANSVTLSMFPYYYEIGEYLSVVDPDKGLATSLQRVFVQRCHRIFDQSTHMRHVNVDTFTRTLCNDERKLFDDGYKSSLSLEEWKKFLRSAHRNERKRTFSQI